MSVRIDEYGRIEGTRTSIHDVFPYMQDGTFARREIGRVLGLTQEQTDAAIEHIAANWDAVAEKNRQIDERIRTAQAEQAKLWEGRPSIVALYREFLAERRDTDGSPPEPRWRETEEEAQRRRRQNSADFQAWLAEREETDAGEVSRAGHRA